MRQAGALAAGVLLAALLVAPGCGLVDSLTPFGVGYQDYTGDDASVNGTWSGTTGGGGAVSFQVGSATVSDFSLVHVGPGCKLPFEDQTTDEPVVNGEFTYEMPLTQGRFVATGRFTSDTTATGTYVFEGMPAGACPSSGSGSFSVQRIF